MMRIEYASEAVEAYFNSSCDGRAENENISG
jgi:hypothetical protein